MFEKNLQQLEEETKIYCLGKAQYITHPKPFNFSLLIQVHKDIHILPLDNKKIELMERFQQNVFTPIAGFHPKIYSMNFAKEIAQYKPLLEQLSLLENQASELYKHYFDMEKPTFDWKGLSHVRTQIYNLPDNPNKKQLMQLFEHGALGTIAQVEPKAYCNLSFQYELEEEDLSETEELYLREDYNSFNHN